MRGARQHGYGRPHAHILRDSSTTRVAQDREWHLRILRVFAYKCETDKDERGAVKLHPITATRTVAGHLIACGSRAASAC